MHVSENITAELQDRHPIPSGDMDGSNDHDIAALDAAFPDAPALHAPLVQVPRVRLTILIR